MWPLITSNTLANMFQTIAQDLQRSDCMKNKTFLEYFRMFLFCMHVFSVIHGLAFLHKSLNNVHYIKGAEKITDKITLEPAIAICLWLIFSVHLLFYFQEKQAAGPQGPLNTPLSKRVWVERGWRRRCVIWDAEMQYTVNISYWEYGSTALRCR